MEDFLKQLNEEQYQAVVNSEGPMMVIAGAGSGKTRVLTYKIAYLLSKGVDPFRVLSLTFTNKAAREMKKRVIQLIGESEGRNVWMGTFHSVFAKVLRNEGHYLGYPSNFSIYDTSDSKQLIKLILKDLNLDYKIYNVAYVLGRISMSKSYLTTPEEYAADPDIIAADESSQKPKIKEVYKAYNARLRRANAMDFDDLLFNTYVLFRDFANVLYKYQQKFKYILVDEYQDTNHAQYLIINKLAANTENICVVGDDAQSIYAFRGANIKNILNFRKDYPDYKLFKLEQNYRSTKIIVQAANQIIKNNRDQIKKTVWTDNEKGNLLGYIHARSESEEGALVADSIFETKMNENLPHNDFAVLYRTNAQSRSMEEALRKLNIPYRIYGGLSFYQRKEIKDLLAYFRLIINYNDDEALLRAINMPARGIGKTTLEKINIAADAAGVSMWEVMNNPEKYSLNINRGTLSKLETFAAMISNFKVEAKKRDAFKMAKRIATVSGLLKMYRDDETPESVSRIENIEELLNGIKDFTERGAEANVGDLDLQGTLAEFMQDVALLTDADKTDDSDNDKVILMTIHAAKGLEFPYVYIVGLEENLFPSVQSITTRADIEEERRLFYVALTRAKKKVFLSHAESRYRWGQFSFTEPSRFLDEVDELLLDKPRFPTGKNTDFRNVAKEKTNSRYGNATQRESKPVDNTGGQTIEPENLQAGMEVVHPKFGKGKILMIEGNGPNKKAIVFFNSVGKKNLLLRFAKLTVVGKK